MASVTTKKRISKKYRGYVFIAPAIILLILVAVFPLINTFTISFQTQQQGKWLFIGFDNYRKLFQDEWFLNAVKNTVIFTVIVTVGHLGIGLIFALLLNERWFLPLRNFIRGVLILPWLFSSAAGSLMWSMLYHPVGFFNSMFTTLFPNATPIDFLGNPRIAMWSIIAVVVWIWYPFYMVSILGGLQSIPTDLYEAAKVDGANVWQRFWFITWPLLRPVLISVSTIDLISTMGHVDVVKMLTAGGPMQATETIGYYVWKTGLRDGQLGYGAAISAILVLAMSFFMFSYLKVVSKGGTSGTNF